MSVDLYSEDLLAIDEHGFERSDDEDDPHGIEEVIEGHIEPVGEGDGDNDDGGDGDAADAGTQTKKPKKERVVKNPQPKLNAQRLKGPRGVHTLSDYFKEFKFRGKRHEKEDLDRVMHRMEHWAHRLFPRFTFNYFLERAEKIGQQALMKTYVKRMRLGMVFDDPVISDDDDNPNKDQAMDIDDPDDPPPDVFGDLFGRPQLPPQTNAPPPRTVSPPITLSDEQLERMRVNRLLAMEKRLARQKAQEEQLNNSNMETLSEQDASTENNILHSEVISSKELTTSFKDTRATPSDDEFTDNTQNETVIPKEVESGKNLEPLLSCESISERTPTSGTKPLASIENTMPVIESVALTSTDNNGKITDSMSIGTDESS